MAKKLFLSFTGLLFALRSGSVKVKDLEDGIFYFGCARDHALHPGKHGERNEVEWVFMDNPKQGVKFHKAIVSALKKAEEEGRVAFRRLSGYNTYEQLNNLLTKNGFAAVDLKQIDPENRSNYNYPTVMEQVEEQGIGLEVVWRA